MRLPIIAMCLFVLLPTSAVSQDQNANQGSPGQSSAPSRKPLRIRIGGDVMQAKLVKEVDPRYPQEAEDANVTGTVVLHAIIGTNGKIQDLKLMTGPPMLIQPAMNAVRQWEYAPVLLNGEPVEVETVISVRFCMECGATPPSSSGASESPSGSTSSSSSSSAKTAGVESTQAGAAQTPAASGCFSAQETQAGSPSSSGAIDPQLKSDLDELLAVMHYEEKATAGMNAMIPSVRKQLEDAFPPTPNKEKILDRFFEELTDLAKTDEFKGAIENVYAKYLTDDDVKAMIAFYKTPAGQHYNDFGSKIILESEQVGEAMGRAHALDIMKDLCKEYPELQGEAAFCPASTKKESSLVAPPGEITPAARP